VQELIKFLGLASYYRRFIHKFVDIVRPLHWLTEQGMPFKWTTKFDTAFAESRLTSSESQGQQEAACARPANITTGVLFTATNAVKFPSTVTQLSWALLLSY